MEKPRIIIADTDINYVTLLQLKFAEELYDKINLEIITQTEYFEDLFLVPQKANVLIISDEFYHNSLSMHNNIEHIFLMTENSDIELEDNPGVIRIYKYSNVNVIFNQVAGASALETKL